VSIAKGLNDSFGTDIKSSTSGFVKPFNLC